MKLCVLNTAANVGLCTSSGTRSVTRNHLTGPRTTHRSARSAWSRGAQAGQVDVEESLPGPRSGFSGSALSGRLHEPAHPPDQRQDVAGGGARAYRSGRDGAGGELVDGGPDPVDGRVLGAALDEQVRVAGMVGERLAQGPQELFEPGPVGARQRPVGRRQDLLEGEPQQLVDQGVLAGEVTVDGADPHARPRGDLLHAGVGAGFAQHVARGGQDGVIVPDRVAPGSQGRVRGGTAHSLSSPVTVPPATIASSAWSSSPASPPRLRAAGISRPASAASASPAAITANPVVYPDSSGSPDDPSCEVTMLAMTAAPMLPPIVRMLAFMPLATPVCEAGTAPTTSADMAENASPNPTPMMALER